MGECMTQEDAMNMNNEQAKQILIPMMKMMRDQNGCPISSAYFALGKAIEALSEDAVPIRRGKWINVEPAIWADVYATCSVCNKRQTLEKVRNFCPNCGARCDDECND